MSAETRGSTDAWDGFLTRLAVLNDAAQSERALMQVPDIDVYVYDRKGGSVMVTYRNEVPSVPRGRWLVFNIANMHVVPQYADISWTVRNDGEEADHIGDLGHIQRGIGMCTAEEATA